MGGNEEEKTLICYHCLLEYSVLSKGSWVEWGWWLEWGTANNPCEIYRKWNKKLDEAPFSKKKIDNFSLPDFAGYDNEGKEKYAVYRCDNCSRWVRRQEITKNQRQLGNHEQRITRNERRTKNLNKKHISLKKKVNQHVNNTSAFQNNQEKTNEKLQSEINQNTQDTKENKQQIRQLEARNTALEKNQTELWGKVFPAKKIPQTIYDFTSWKYYVGWPIFLIAVGYVFKKVRRIRKRKVKITQNYLTEIRQIFQEWQLNMYASTAGYVVGFYLIQQAINKWINPRISNWLVTQKLITLSVVCLIIGIGFYVDGIITSSLKTPLQRLSIKIENAAINEKVKKSLLSKTQKVNELFKETLKRFGLLAVVGILTKLIVEFWNEHLITLLSYAVPIAGALKIIWKVDKSLKKLKLNGSKKN